MVAFLILVGLLLFWIGSATDRQRRRVLGVTAAASATSIGNGRVALRGVARGDPPEPSAVTGKPCAYWEAELYEYRQRSGVDGSKWPIRAKETAKAAVIWLELQDGRIPVLLHGVEWAFAGEDEFCERNPIPPTGHAFVERYGFRSTDRIKVVERRIEDGGPLHVLGTVGKAGDVLRVVDQSKASWIWDAVATASDTARRMALRQPGGHAAGSTGSRPTCAPLGDIPPRADGLAGSTAATPDSAAILRRLGPEGVIVWCERSGLLIGNGDRAGLARRLQRTALACKAAATVVFLMALALLLLAITA
jgi:hypothetical protein